MLEGEWTMVLMEQKGTKVMADGANRFRLSVKGDQWTVVSLRGQETRMTFQIDPSQNPPTIDLILKSGDQEAVSRGIYRLEGDTLTVCRTAGDAERPKEFKTTAESGVLVVWKRAGT